MGIFSSITKFLRIEKIPVMQKEQLQELAREMADENYFRLAYLSLAMFALECYLYTIQGSIFYVGPVIKEFLIACALFLPLIWFIKRKIKTIGLVFPLMVQYAFIALCLIFGASLALYIQSEVDLIHMYLMMVFFAAAFFTMRPWGSAILFLMTYLYFLFLLPHYVSNPNTMLVIQINTAFSNLAAWAMSNVLWRAKVSVFSNRKILHKQNNILLELNKKDAMTGLYNHETSLQILEAEMMRSVKLNHPLSLIIADIDDFKKVNDNHGHLSGDYVIKNVAKAIAVTVRKTDFVGRYGGEEFIIVMPFTDMASACALSRRIQSEIGTAYLYGEIRVTLSGGISQFGGESLNEFIRVTDQKLYIAKNTGKNIFETDSSLYRDFVAINGSGTSIR